MIEWIRGWLARQVEARRATRTENAVVVTTSDVGISARYPSGEVSSIAWEGVTLIAIDTNDSGPWGDDVWWVLEGKGERCVYPGGSTGDLDALKVMEARFAGFSDEAVIKAMGCTSNHRFVCWQQSSELGVVP